MAAAKAVWRGRGLGAESKRKDGGGVATRNTATSTTEP